MGYTSVTGSSKAPGLLLAARKIVITVITLFYCCASACYNITIILIHGLKKIVDLIYRLIDCRLIDHINLCNKALLWETLQQFVQHPTVNFMALACAEPGIEPSPTHSGPRYGLGWHALQQLPRHNRCPCPTCEIHNVT